MFPDAPAGRSGAARYDGLLRRDFSTKVPDGTNNSDFLFSGVPNPVADQDAAPYLPNHHAKSDNFAMVDRRNAKLNASDTVARARMQHPASKTGGRRDLRLSQLGY